MIEARQPQRRGREGIGWMEKLVQGRSRTPQLLKERKEESLGGDRGAHTGDKFESSHKVTEFWNTAKSVPETGFNGASVIINAGPGVARQLEFDFPEQYSP